MICSIKRKLKKFCYKNKLEHTSHNKISIDNYNNIQVQYAQRTMKLQWHHSKSILYRNNTLPTKAQTKQLMISIYLILKQEMMNNTINSWTVYIFSKLSSLCSSSSDNGGDSSSSKFSLEYWKEGWPLFCDVFICCPSLKDPFFNRCIRTMVHIISTTL